MEEVGNAEEVADPTRGMKGSVWISTRRRHSANGDTKGRITDKQTKPREIAATRNAPEHNRRSILSLSRRKFWKAFRGESLDIEGWWGHMPNKVYDRGNYKKSPN